MAGEQGLDADVHRELLLSCGIGVPAAVHLSRILQSAL